MRARMMTLSFAAFVIGLSAAHARDLEGPDINNLIGGKTVRLNTPIGIQLPLRYRSNGVVAGDLTGFSMASMFAPKEEGRWWVDGKRLCQKWPSWYQGRTFCFTLKSTGPNKLSWVRNDGAKGTAVILD